LRERLYIVGVMISFRQATAALAANLSASALLAGLPLRVRAR
jgi:hypothetical protein